ncbi:LOW QUALITY PROTEIN: sacsin-like [Polymixia lowei]
MSSKMHRNSRNSFGATAPPFIDYLKDILRRYPDGGQILKELIQNADDAEATEVIFIHDERSYGNESLWIGELGKYQGPALYAYNNAMFTADDWKGIQATGRSVKRNDPNKVGRFGIGFNSVYHITDVPSIFSSGHLGLLDPQEKLFGRGNGGFQWSLADTEDQETLMTLNDQFQPFQDIVSLVRKQKWADIIMKDQQFDGALFRFPLRNEASDISDNLYDSERVAQLFDSFIADADLSLLFLKNVTSVSLIQIKTDNSVNVRLEVTCSHSTDVVLESGDESIINGSTSFKEITLSSEDYTETKKWLVTKCCMKEGNIAKLDSLAKKLCFLPQVDLAFPCGQDQECSDSRLSCFLPLPDNESNKTGLPVYVNACFGLTDNRRHIKWQEEDQKYDEAALWNELLVKEVLPQAYLRMLQDAVNLAKASALPVSSVYGLWPDITQMQHKDKWYTVALDVLQRLFRQNVAVLSLAADETSFVTPSEAVLPSNDSASPEIAGVIRRILVSCGENLVTFPDCIASAIKEAYPNPQTLRHVTPTFLRAVLHRISLHNISKEDKLSLLEYILSDGKYRELQGLQLLPFSDGTFRSFTDKEEDIAFIDSNEFPRDLLPGCKNLFIPEDLSVPLHTHLKEVARRGLFKVVNINANQVAEYVKRYLPTGWKQTNMSYVTWEIGNSEHPPSGWLREFWKFLNTHYRELHCFTGMPLIPITPLENVNHPLLLARLNQNSTLIFQKSKQTSLPDHIVEMVKKVGGTVVRGEEWLKHEDLDSYVLCPSPRSVMQVFVNLGSQHIIREIQTISYREREELKVYLSSLESLSVNEKDVLSKLPLFQTMNGSCVAAQSKQAVLLSSGITVPTELPMPDSVVKCATEADRRLLQLLNIDLLDTAQAAILLIDCLQRRNFEKDYTQKTMTWILQHGNILFSQNETLKRKCKDFNFIQMNGELKKTSSFFDPRIETFKGLFELHFFPPPVYTQTSQMLESLTDLGLLNKETDVTSSHLLHAAKEIEKLHVHSQDEAVKRSQLLLRLLDANDLLSKFSTQQLQCLSKLKWVPCVQPSKDKKQCKTTSFFCPQEIRHSDYKDIVGHVMPLKGELSDRVSYKLGLKRFPPPEKVLENLSVLSSIAQAMDNPDTDVDFKSKLYSTYKYMQDHISEFTKVVNKNTRWLWAHNQFASPQDLVLDYPPNLDLSSYIGRVPKEFLPYKKLLEQFGLRLLLSEEEIVGILHSVKQSIEERQPPFASSSELEVSIAILNWLWREKKTVKDDIPVPVITEGEQMTLKPLSTTVFCDISKDGLKELVYSQEEFYVIHDEIPKATAEWLNIPLLSTRILSPELVGIEQCGQSEPITMRIKNILKEYDEESDMFKELIQNAEDARAKACKFMVDFRVHKDPPESLIDPGMTLCQGPCLWAFNDELFSEDDWGNIVRVGSASKENMVEKIGMFGLGFNTVYHVTDVPSILSGNKLLILDPNVTHLKKHIKNKTNPGIKLDLSQKRLLHWFPGQFRPYEHIFNSNFTRQSTHEPYPGTLIKLPFRTQAEALQSEISTKVYDRHNIITFQQDFTSNSQTHLLFLRNINTVSLQNITDDASTPPRDDQIKTVFTVSKAIVNTMQIPDETCVLKQSQAENRLMNVDKKCKEVIECSTVSIVKITQQDCSGTNVQSWLLYNCFGTEQSLQMALEKKNQTKFSLPIGGIAVPLQNNPENTKWVASKTELVGQAFCFLPLAIHTGLPVNVNGAFAVTSNRKGLWENGVKHDWNKALLQDPVRTAYISVLLELQKMSENKHLESYCYYTFWPNREEVTETFKPLVDAFYSAIAQQSPALELFSDGKHWCSMNKVIFLHQSIEEDKNIGALAMEVCQNHVKAPNHVVPLPLWLRNSFIKAGLEQVLQSRMWNWETFYQEVVFRNLSTMDPKSRNALLLHAIDLNITAIDNLLMRYPCIPTQSGQLQYIKRLINPSGKVACLFEQEEGRLLGGTKSDFCCPKRIQRLLELGMLNDHLPLEEITERAGRITNIWSTDKRKAYGHLKSILGLLRNHLHDDHSPYWDTLRNTAFIPASPPVNQNMDGLVTLERPIDVFSQTYYLLVNMTQPVVDQSNLKIHSDDRVLQILGVCQGPTLETVLQQLQEACRQSQSSNETMLQKIAHECYNFLNQWLHEQGDSSLISERAHSFPFILVGNKFVHVKSVAESDAFKPNRYLHVLPTVFTSFRRLWECVGVEKRFTVSQFQTVLQKLHALHGNNPLPESDLAICLTITRAMYDAKEEEISDSLIPNEHGVLQPARELYFNDSPWMPLTSGVTLCHENIPRVMACYFGIKTTRHHTLQNHLVNILPLAFEFEQREQLTVRIKNIIAAYPSKKDILKELIQNADDAESTEIHFVLDKRQHGTQKTFGEKWNELQGPALCVYNNKVFSDADLKGIQQLGEGGKHNTPGKTGKYGLGFNSVYHLTDCPSIVTGDILLCISDPNQKYIESSSGKPKVGCGYKLADVFKEMYNDVYKSFLPDEFVLEEGTMFRLPLRTGAMANNSKISDQGVTDRDIKDLISALSDDPEGLILFLKNIQKIQFHEINAKSGELKTIFKVEKSHPEKCNKEIDWFQKHLQNALQSDKPVTPHEAIYEVQIATSDKRQSKWVIAQQFGTFKSSTGTESKQSDKLPQAALAACVSCTPARKEFIGGAFCSLPLPGKTGLPIHVDGNFEVDSSRRDLWKEDGQSLKTNWNQSLKKNIIAPLYADLLHYICSSISKMKVPSIYIPNSCLDNSHLCFYPIVSKDVAQDWHEMIHEVYRSIHERALDVIPVLQSSTRLIAQQSIREFSFDWCNVRETGPTNAPHLIGPMNAELIPILEDLGMRLVPLSTKMTNIWTSFKSAGVKIKSVSPSTVGNFLREKPLNDSTQTKMGLPLPISHTLIKDEKRCSKLLDFCLRSLKKEESCSLNGLPLLLTKDKVLRVFNSNDPKLISRYDRLFFGYADYFADFPTNNKHIEVLQQGNFVNNLTIPSAVQYLKPLLHCLLQDCEVDPLCNLHVPNETILMWLKELWRFLTSQINPVMPPNRSDKQSVTMGTIKELFSDCSILPVVCPRLNNKRFLQTMKDMPSVIQSSSQDELSRILFKLGCMELDILFFTEMDTQARLLLYNELMNTNDKSSVLDQVYKMNHSEFCQLSTEELKELQCFLQSGISTSKDKQDYQRKLKSLPLFETIQGERVRIDGPREVFILNISIKSLTRFPDLFMLHESNNIFLKHSIENESLSDILKIQILTELQYFLKLILPVLHKLTERQLLHCIKMLLSLQHDDNYHQYRDTIISSMKTVKLIRSAHGNLEKASYYFDESVELYKIMLPQEKFVPQRFWDELCDGEDMKTRGKELLKAFGMKHEVSKEEIIDFAHQIEKESKGNIGLKELKQKSSKLLRAMIKASDGKTQNLLGCIAEIKFIFPVEIREQLCNYHCPFAVGRTAVALRGSLIESDPKHQNLIWTSMPIIALPTSRSEKIMQMIRAAGALEQPPQQFVTRNMSNICQLPCQTGDLIKTRAEVFRDSYAYLQTNTFESGPLTGLPVVLVENDTKLVKTEETSLVLPDHLEFRPYLYKIPPKDVMYAEFFKKTGVNEEPTALQYCNVLAAIYVDSSDKETLNPNQQQTVKRAVQQLFLLIKTNKQNRSAIKLPRILYLPSTDGRLYPSNTLHFNDTVFQASRLEEAFEKKLLLEKLSICYLGNDMYEHQRLLQLLPQEIRPKMLSQHIREQVVESCMQRCEHGTECEFSGWFDKHLSSIAFRHGLICLIREQSEGEISQEDAADMCEQTFGCIQIVCCRSLETELLFDQQPLNNTGAEIDVYVQKREQGCIFYLKHNDITAANVINEVNMTLTKEINALLGNKVALIHLPVLGQLLTCNSLQEVQKTLAKHGIHDSATTENSLLHPPIPWTAISEEWLDSLDMNVLNNFEEGEHVGYCTNEEYIHAVIVEQLPGPSGQYSCRYKIQIGQDEVIEVSSVDLYQFKREKELKQKKKTHKSAEATCMELELLEGSELNGSGTSSSRPSFTRPSSTSSSSTRSSPASLEEAKKEIDKCFAEIWTLPEEEKNKAIKRLYLRWHPDKNPDCQQLATEAFKYLQNKIDELMKGKTAGSSSSSSSSQWNANFRNFYEHWNQEARRHRNGRERFFRGYRSYSYNFWTHHGNVPRPNREEAQRWCRQARCDLTAAHKDMGGGSTEWCLFKIHQAVEKSLIAAEYKRSGQHPTDCSISVIAQSVSCYDPQLRNLPQIVEQLKLVGVDGKKTQYPNCHPSPHIPNGQFKTENEKPALDMAAELLSKVEAYVN